jgi:hypothetical protein
MNCKTMFFHPGANPGSRWTIRGSRDAIRGTVKALGAYLWAPSLPKSIRRHFKEEVKGSGTVVLPAQIRHRGRMPTYCITKSIICPPTPLQIRPATGLPAPYGSLRLCCCCLETETEAQVEVPEVRRAPVPDRRSQVPAAAATVDPYRTNRLTDRITC